MENVYGEFVQVKSDAESEKYFECYTSPKFAAI